MIRIDANTTTQELCTHLGRLGATYELQGGGLIVVTHKRHYPITIWYGHKGTHTGWLYRVAALKPTEGNLDSVEQLERLLA